ncbi:trypsin-like serine protease [Vibrio astriarenae]|uniref:Trypsin-like serine protease n=1 Tax=Vibrio astriarenae TaxID=1481923 RepID=A0A7Z2YF43_9VIBR|nr:trypsin-like serine protease [Vibrio astriarenae]QIA65011.1 trypsin-like serine protease [Vibrio astriarenae]
MDCRNKLALAVALALPNTAWAVEYGVDATSDEYNDFNVHIVFGNSHCGATLLGGDYLITARHCIITDGSDRNDSTGMTGTIEIRQGLSYTGDKTTLTDFTTVLDGTNADIESAASQRMLYYADVILGDYPNAAQTALRYDGDLVVLKLQNTVQHYTGVAITPMRDITTGKSVFPADQAINFYGWGRDENGSNPATLQKAQLKSFYGWGDVNEQLWQRVDEVDSFAYVSCTDEHRAEQGLDCEYKPEDRAYFYGLGKQHVASGDSGTGLVYDNQLFGVARSVFGGSGESTFTHFSTIMPELTQAINKVVYPPVAGAELEEGFDQTLLVKIPIQNLTSSDVLFTPTLSDDNSGMVDMDAFDCNSVIPSQEGCIIKLYFNYAQQVIDTEYNVTIDLTDTIDIPVKFAVASDDSDGDNGGNGGNDVGSGGSVGGVFWFAMLFVGLIRKHRWFK